MKTSLRNVLAFGLDCSILASLSIGVVFAALALVVLVALATPLAVLFLLVGLPVWALAESLKALDTPPAIDRRTTDNQDA